MLIDSMLANIKVDNSFLNFMNRGAPSNTPARNRKQRRVASWMRTKGRLNRAMSRLLPQEQSLRVAAAARKFRNHLETR